MFYNAFTPHKITHQVKHFSDELTRVYDPKDLWKLMVECQCLCLCDRNKAIVFMIFFFFSLSWVHTVWFFISFTIVASQIVWCDPSELLSKIQSRLCSIKYLQSLSLSVLTFSFECEIEVKLNNLKYLIALTLKCFAREKNYNSNSSVVAGQRDHGLLVAVSLVLSYGKVMFKK